MTHPTPYMMSIEPVGERGFRYGFHLGTDLKVARDCVVDRFNGRNAMAKEIPGSVDSNGRPMATQTIALLDAKGKIVDVYDGTWRSDAE